MVIYEAWEKRERREGGAEQHGSVALRGKNSFTAGWESTFYRNPELQMRENDDYFLYPFILCSLIYKFKQFNAVR